MKLTVFEPANTPMDKNQFKAKTYLEWCKKEAERLGDGYRVYTAHRIGSRVVKPFTPKSTIWCRIEKV